MFIFNLTNAMTASTGFWSTVINTPGLFRCNCCSTVQTREFRSSYLLVARSRGIDSNPPLPWHIGPATTVALAALGPSGSCNLSLRFTCLVLDRGRLCACRLQLMINSPSSIAFVLASTWAGAEVATAIAPAVSPPKPDCCSFDVAALC